MIELSLLLDTLEAEANAAARPDSLLPVKAADLLRVVAAARRADKPANLNQPMNAVGLAEAARRERPTTPIRVEAADLERLLEAARALHEIRQGSPY